MMIKSHRLRSNDDENTMASDDADDDVLVLRFKVCKFFLEAVETNKYGWFWSCPTGDGCIYRHCLPPGNLNIIMRPCHALFPLVDDADEGAAPFQVSR